MNTTDSKGTSGTDDDDGIKVGEDDGSIPISD